MKQLFIILSFMLPFYTVTAQQAVDVHCHNILPEFKALLDRHGAALEETFPLPDWNIDAHLEFMEAAGIRTSLLSMPAPQPYFGNVEESRQMVRRYNEACAKLKADYPGKFLFCASLPLPDVEAAIEKAVYALDTLGADGIKLATNSRGQYVGDEALDPLMEVLNKRKAVIILHPHKPSPVNESIIATAPLAIYEYPAETTHTVINMIARNVPARYPDIRFVVPHCGSFLPLAIPRMKAILPAMQAKGYMQPVDWEANLSHLYYDLAGGATPEVVKSLLTITTPDHLLYGSDYPYQPAAVLTENLKRMRSWIAENEEVAPYSEGILANNAIALFNDRTNRPNNMKMNNGGRTDMCTKEPMQTDGIVRLSKIEVYPQHLDEYMKFATEVGEVSLRTEPGVLTMYAVGEKENPCKITILETYASREAYEKHIASEHFQKYKQGTLHMVKSLVLSDQTPLNPANRIILISVFTLLTFHVMAQEKIVQTAGRDQLGNFAPKFVELNDDVLFGEVWSRTDKLGLRDRSLVTITSLISQGITDSSLTYHLQSAKNNGITRTEIAEIITHIAFYAGWPKAWTAFRLAKEVWAEDMTGEDAKAAFQREMIFPIGEPNTAYAQYFIGNSYLAPISREQVNISNVTFEPGCRNNWHIHHATKGGGQMLIGVAGRDWYQEEGKPAQEILPGTVIHIPANVKHWHGAAADSWFAHLAFEVSGENTSNEWLEPVTDEQYDRLK